VRAADAAPEPQPAAVEALEAPVLASPVQRAEAAARRERRRRLTAQREAVRSCESQFAEATQECRKVFELIGSEPKKASAQCEALTRAFLDKMLVGERDLTLRLLGEGAGDRATLHAVNVGVVSLLMGRVFGLSADDMLDLGVGALLHDVGKAELPERLRFPAEHFTPSEQKYYQEHVGHGVATGRRMGLRAGALLVIGQHHEHADGSGFPLQLGSDRLTVAARIVALVDRYDNLCNPPLATKALTPHEALSLLFAQGKSQFDTAILGAFIKMMGVYPPGSAVQLTDDRYALVTAVNSTRPLKPRVLVYDPQVPRDEALLIDLQLAPGLGIRRSLKPLALPRPALDYLSPRPRTLYFFEPAGAVEPAEALAAAA
jgi:HD-GYP domain-containing protein (c-di-GMP phosphodiesterase class II)